jgi:hypothetical protein
LEHEPVTRSALHITNVVSTVVIAEFFMASGGDPEPWSERDVLVLYAGLSIGTSIPDIAAALDRTVEDVRERVASLKPPEDRAR